VNHHLPLGHLIDVAIVSSQTRAQRRSPDDSAGRPLDVLPFLEQFEILLATPHLLLFAGRCERLVVGRLVLDEIAVTVRIRVGVVGAAREFLAEAFTRTARDAPSTPRRRPSCPLFTHNPRSRFESMYR
jgi:AcrR family transcriptional regulator